MKPTNFIHRIKSGSVLFNTQTHTFCLLVWDWHRRRQNKTKIITKLYHCARFITAQKMRMIFIPEQASTTAPFALGNCFHSTSMLGVCSVALHPTQRNWQMAYDSGKAKTLICTFLIIQLIWPEVLLANKIILKPKRPCTCRRPSTATSRALLMIC